MQIGNRIRPGGRLTGMLIAFLSLILLFISSAQVLADGNEELGPPSITIAEGTGLIAAGTGMVVQPATIQIDVGPGTVQQVLLYWDGVSVGSNPPDDTIVINGNSVTGLQIGLSPFENFINASYRADITSLGLISDGSNTLTVSGLDFGPDGVEWGAGLLVIVDDGSGAASIEIRDGLDTAFGPSPSPFDTTVPQTFTFPPAGSERTANLDMFFASVEGSTSGFGQRPNAIVVTVGGSTPLVFDNLLDSNDGQEWDTVRIPIPIPAGATSLTVQAFSVDNLNTGNLVASFDWIAAGLSVPPPPLCSIGDFVWEDADRDGCQGIDERGINGVTVELYEDCSFSNKIAEDVTKTGGPGNQDGFYEFQSLVCGQQYGIRFVDDPVDIYAQTDPNSCPDENNNDDTTDSDCGDDGRVCATAGTDSEPGTINDTIDCGYVCEGVIGDRVWLDSNGSPGCQDTNEPPLEGITVKLFETCADPPNPDNQVGDPAVTDVNGKFEFTGLCPGNYLVKFEDPLGRDNTTPGNPCDDDTLIGGGGESSDSNCGDPDLECVELTVKDNPVDLTIDCGKIPPPGCKLDLIKECRVETPPGGDVCDVLGKPVALTFQYIPGTTVNTAQDSGKAAILFDSGAVDDDGVSFVIVTDQSSAANALSGGGKRFFAGNVAFNELFEANEATADFGSQTYIHFFDDSSGGLLQSITYHTSCSQPIQLGDVIGNATLVAYVGESGSGSLEPKEPNKVCEVTKTPGGDVCDVLGKPVALTFQYIPGTTVNTAQDSGKAAILFDSGAVDDDGVSFVIVTDQSSAANALGGGGKRFFAGNVAFNELFEANEATADFGSQTYIHFFDDSSGGLLQSITYHTSCSQPIQLGDVIGNATLVAYAGESGSTANGTPVTYLYTVMGVGDQEVSNVALVDDLLGPIPGPESGDDGDGILEPGEKWIYKTETMVDKDTTNIATVTGKFAGTDFACEEDQDSSTVIFVEPTCKVSIQLDKIEDRKIKWKLSNPSSIPATIETLTIAWLGSTKLKKVKYDGSDILKDVLLTSPATITSDEWLKEPKDRTVKAGDTGKVLELEFDVNFPLKKEQPPSDFDLTVTFEQGCEVSF